MKFENKESFLTMTILALLVTMFWKRTKLFIAFVICILGFSDLGLNVASAITLVEKPTVTKLWRDGLGMRLVGMKLFKPNLFVLKDSSSGSELFYSRYISDRIQIEPSLFVYGDEIDQPGTSVGMFALNLKCDLIPQKSQIPIRPYLGVGGGLLMVDRTLSYSTWSDTIPGITGIAGVEFFPKSRFHLGVEARILSASVSEITEERTKVFPGGNVGGFSFGLAFGGEWGGKGRKPGEVSPREFKLLSQGIEFMNCGYYQKAIERFNLAIESNPYLASAYYFRAVVWSEIDKLDLAKVDGGKAIMIEPDNRIYREFYELVRNPANAYLAKARKAVSLEDIGVAFKYYTKAIELNPNLAEAYYERGLFRAACGELSEARLDILTAIVLDSTNERYQKSLILINALYDKE